MKAMVCLVIHATVMLRPKAAALVCMKRIQEGEEEKKREERKKEEGRGKREKKQFAPPAWGGGPPPRGSLREAKS